MLKGILFDFDGTLVDSEKIHFALWNQVLQPYGVSLSPQAYRDEYAGKTTPQNAEDLVRTFGLLEDPPQLAAEKQARYYDWLQAAELPLMPYAREAVAFFFSKGLKLAVVTGSTKPGVLLSLERCGLLPYLLAVVTRDDVEHSKPHPESYQQAVAALQLTTGDCIAFEDTENGLKSAKAASVACYAVRTEFSATHDFSLADWVFDDLQEATAWVASAYRL